MKNQLKESFMDKSYNEDTTINLDDVGDQVTKKFESSGLPGGYIENKPNRSKRNSQISNEIANLALALEQTDATKFMYFDDNNLE